LQCSLGDNQKGNISLLYINHMLPISSLTRLRTKHRTEMDGIRVQRTARRHVKQFCPTRTDNPKEQAMIIVSDLQSQLASIQTKGSSSSKPHGKRVQQRATGPARRPTPQTRSKQTKHRRVDAFDGDGVDQIDSSAGK